MKEHATSSVPEPQSKRRCGPSPVLSVDVEAGQQPTGFTLSASRQLLEGCREPRRSELRAIEQDSELLEAELALVDAECQWHANPNPETAADLFGALIRLVDIYDLMVEPTGRAVA